MKVFTSKDFDGRWPVPVAAVVVANDKAHARDILAYELISIGLRCSDFTLQEIDTTKAGVTILSDGEY